MPYHRIPHRYHREADIRNQLNRPEIGKCLYPLDLTKLTNPGNAPGPQGPRLNMVKLA